MSQDELLTNIELLSRMRLQLLPKVGLGTARKILTHFGSAETFFRTASSDLKTLGFKNIEELKNSKYLELAKREWEWIHQKGYGICSLGDAHYPSLLKECVDAPLILFFRGAIRWPQKRIISIVGTRKISQAGKRFIERFIEELAPYNPLIVSGFAYGADITAQRAAVKHQLQTVGCLAHGLDRIYPSAHYSTAQEVVHNGGFITEFYKDTPPKAFQFVQRNRIIAGMSEATVMVESPLKGGSLITSSMAHGYDREVFAVPAHPEDRFKQGGNELIKNFQAQLLTKASDLVKALQWEPLPKKVEVKSTLPIEDLFAKELYEYLGVNGATHLDALCIHLNKAVFQLTPLLFEMELNGWVRALPGKYFEAI